MSRYHVSSSLNACNRILVQFVKKILCISSFNFLRKKTNIPMKCNTSSMYKNILFYVE